MDFWTALFLFFGGVLAQRAGSYLFLYTKKIAFFNDCAFAGLRMFKFVSDNIETVNDLKYIQMEKQGLTQEKIQKEKESDEKTLAVWHEIAIVGIKNLLPPKLRPMLRFNTWEEAMRLLIKRDLSQGK
tara:strand:+ start:135 stop:518 length:384 start_codon:yes stop_codon:yes gene_type:complete